MKILHLLTTSTFSGAENVCINLMQIAKDNYEVYYTSLDGPIKEVLHKNGLIFIPLKKIGIKEISKTIKSIDPDIIHAHDIRASVYAAICSDVPIISHIHGKFDDMSKMTLKSILYKILSFKFKKVLYVSKSIKEEFFFKSILEKKGLFLPNRINEEVIHERLNNITDNKKYEIVYIGRLEEPKDPFKFLHVVKKIQETLPAVRTCMVGEGTLKKECLEQVMKLHLNVEIAGFQEEPLNYLKNSKILLITSKREGLPIVALEATAAEKPIVSTPTDGMLEIIKNGYNGYISNDIQELADFCLKLISDKKEYEKIVENIKKNSMSSFDNYRKSILNVYLEILNSKKRKFSK